jgi:hypothetical protein
VSTGRCLCGAVTYEVAGPLRQVIVCHCADCRRWHGRGAAMTCARRDRVAIHGEESLRWYGAPDGPERGFCARCGSSLFWVAPGRPTVSIAAGTLDDPGPLRAVAHIFCEDERYDDREHPDGVLRFARGAPPEVAAPPGVSP